jgi:hypothetical protein
MALLLFNADPADFSGRAKDALSSGFASTAQLDHILHAIDGLSNYPPSSVNAP